MDNLSIEHALPIELDHAQLKAGTVQTDQFIAPAVSADADSIAMCGGTIPMGAHFALRPDLDISQAGLTPEGQALAKAYQKYGGYVVDAAGFTTSLAMVTGATAQQINNLHTDAAWIRSNLVMILPAAATETFDDISFGNSTTAAYPDTATGDKLMLSDGTNTASIALLGVSSGSAFAIASDGSNLTSSPCWPC